MTPAEIRDALHSILVNNDDHTIKGGIWLLSASDAGRLSRLLRETEEVQ